MTALLAGATLGHLTGLGVRDFVVCAGARNAPLVTSLLASPHRRQLRIWHHFDERTAAFFALGLAKVSSRPTAIFTTSGTAVAELHPAVVEGFYSGIPLILVTADRPRSFRGSGAPQAIWQDRIFGPHAPTCLDVAKPSDWEGLTTWAGDSPLHLNVCFEEPTEGDLCADWQPGRAPAAPSKPEPPDFHEWQDFCNGTERLVVLVGELPVAWRRSVEEFLLELRAPVWAEATSGLRESALLTECLIRQESQVSAMQPGGILRIGGIPSLRFWRDLEDCVSVPVYSVSPRRFSGLVRSSSLLVCEDFPRSPLNRRISEPCMRRGFATHGFQIAPGRRDPPSAHFGDASLVSLGPGGIAADPHPTDAALESALSDHPGSEPAAFRELSRHIPPEAQVFLGNSLPIREWNLAATTHVPHPHCFASRGANGIDGQIATFLGLSAEVKEAWGIFGDLTALCDLNAPALLSQLAPTTRRIVIINNRGGRIFSRLRSMEHLPESQKRITENRHRIRFDHWAAMWGLGYVLWNPCEPFPDLPAAAVVLEVVPNPAESDAFWATRQA